MIGALLGAVHFRFERMRSLACRDSMVIASGSWQVARACSDAIVEGRS